MNLNREILRLSIPAIVSNVTVPLLGLCDTAISGHLGSALFLAAIAVGSLMMSVIFRLFGFLRMGTTGLTANAFGSGDAAAIRDAFSRSLFLALLIGVGMMLFRTPLLQGMLWLVGADAGTSSLASDYFRICIYGAPAQMAIMAVSGWLVGMQSTMRAMVVAVAVNVINIIASFLMVFHLGMGFEGVAYGTLLSNWAGALLAILLSLPLAPEGGLWCGWGHLFRGGGLRRFFTVNTDLFLRSACVMAVTMAVTAYSARLGAIALASNAVMQQFFTFFSFFMDGYAFTGEALCGRFYGSSDAGMLRKSVRYLLWWSAGIAILFSLLYMIGWRPVVDILTNDLPVRSFIADFHIWIVLIPPVTVMAFIYDGFFIGVTRTRSMLLATLAASAVFFAVTLPHFGTFSKGDLTAVFITNSSLSGSFDPGILFNNNLIWASFLIYLLLRGLILAVIWHRSTPSVAVKSFAQQHRGV